MIPSIVTVGLVSNGKSTLINSMLGYYLMPTDNLTCTALMVSIIDDFNDSNIVTYTLNNTRIEFDKGELKNRIRTINESDEGGHIIFHERIRGLDCDDIQFEIIDTPGINDATNPKHSQMTIDLIKTKIPQIILYVANVRSCGTDDERLFLEKLASIYKKRKTKIHLVIAINGKDLIDYDKTPEQMYVDVESQLVKKCGLPEPSIVLVSAKSAYLCRKYLNGDNLERHEKRFINYLCETDKLNQIIIDDVLEHSGVPELELTLHSLLCKVSKKEIVQQILPKNGIDNSEHCKHKTEKSKKINRKGKTKNSNKKKRRNKNTNNHIENKQGNYFVTESGMRYHSKECAYIKNRESQLFSKKELKHGKYVPCKRCLKNK